MIYLDSAATSFLKPPCVPQAVRRAMAVASSPGRGAYPSAIRAAELVYDCREAAAELFHMNDPSRVVFTGSATHALNIAIRSVVGRDSRVLISGFEHNAVTRPLAALGADVRVFGRNLFDPGSLLAELRESLAEADAVVCTHMSNVFGYVLPIREIAALCRQMEVPLVIDASQSAGLLELDMQSLGAAFIAMPGHKSLYGPQGTGILLCGRGAEPLLYGGTGSASLPQTMPEHLPERLEAGTMNVPGIAGLCAGIRYVLDRTARSIRCHEDRLLTLAECELSGLPGLELFSADRAVQSGILSFRTHGRDCEAFCSELAERGIAARAGLHCAPLAHESAGTLDTGLVRLSFSPFVSAEQVERCCAVIRSILKD